MYARAWSLLDEKQALTVFRVACEKKIAPITVFTVWDEICFEDQIVVTVRDVEKFDRSDLPMLSCGLELVEDGICLHRNHVFCKLDVLHVGLVGGLTVADNVGVPLKPRVACNGRRIVIYAEYSAYIKSAHGERHFGFEICRVYGCGGNLLCVV